MECGEQNLRSNGYSSYASGGEEILRQGLKIDKILYSPLIRAKETARQISEAAGIPMKEEIRLKEQNFGMYESTPRDGAEFKKAKENFVSSYGGGESMLKLCQRIYNLLDDLRERSDTETVLLVAHTETVLLVAHNGIARAVHSYFYDMTNEEFAAFGMKNCQIRRYDF